MTNESKVKTSELMKYDLIDYDEFDSFPINNFLLTKKRTHYNFKATTGFIAGVILDQVIPGTFGFITMKLKGFGKLLYSCKVQNRYINQLCRVRYVGNFVRGFLE